MKVVTIMEDLIAQATSGHGDRSAKNYPIPFGTVNVGIISGKANKVAEMFTLWNIHLCC